MEATLRTIGSRSALAACCALVAACHSSPAPISTQPAAPDQSKVFFPATVDTYGLNLSQIDREHLAELYALRQIDPCGFVDQQTLAGSDRKDFSYSHTAVEEIGQYGFGPVHPDGGDACTVAFPSPRTGLSIQVLPGESRWNDSQFTPDPSHPGVARSAAPNCAFRVTLPLKALSGAPPSMREPMAEVRTTEAIGGTPSTGDATSCRLTETVADNMAEQVHRQGIPIYPGHDSVAAKFLTSDPCAAAADLHAVGVTWQEPRPDAQWPTTWRHPGVCNLALTPSEGGVSSAVVKLGLAVWSDRAVSSPDGSTPSRSAQDGVTLFDFTTTTTNCATYVIAKTDLGIPPTRSGPGAPDLATSTPVVTVRLTTATGTDCAETAKQAALNAVKRAT